jgi:hypothetical protein
VINRHIARQDFILNDLFSGGRNPGKNQSNTDIFPIGLIPVSPITARSESARHFDICKEKSREILDWLINEGIIT